MCQIRKKNRLLRSAARYAILRIEKGKARNTRPTLKQSATYLFTRSAVHYLR